MTTFVHACEVIIMVGFALTVLAMAGVVMTIFYSVLGDIWNELRRRHR